MSTKLRNIDAIKKMLSGTHQSQSKTSVGYKKQAEEVVERNFGDVWEEDGHMWIQQNGFKIRKGKLDEIRALVKSRQMPVKCPKCDQPMTKRLDKKFWALEKHCMDCQIAYEHQLKIDGKYEAYEKDRILKNAEAWLKDAEQEAIDIIEAFRNPITFANVDGDLEDWSGGKTGPEMADIIEKEFNNFKENFINKLKQELENDKT